MIMIVGTGGITGSHLDRPILPCNYQLSKSVVHGYSCHVNIRDQARGRIGRNSRPRGRNFALDGTQGEVGVSLKKKKKKFFFFFFFF